MLGNKTIVQISSCIIYLIVSRSVNLGWDINMPVNCVQILLESQKLQNVSTS